MKAEEMVRRSKKVYDAIEIPDELIETIRQSIKLAGKENQVVVLPKKQIGRKVAVWAACLLLCFIAALNISEPFAAAVTNMPVVGTIFRVFTWRSYVQADADKIVQVEVPQITGEGSSGVIADVNEEIQTIVEQYKRQAEQNIAEYKAAFLATGGTEEEFAQKDIKVDVHYNIRCESGTLLSLELVANENWCNAYGVRYFYNLDLTTERILTLKDILGKDYVSIANASIREQMQKRMNQDENLIYWDGSDGMEGFTTVDENTKFYLNEAGNPVVVFDAYEIAPGAFGAQEFEIIP